MDLGRPAGEKSWSDRGAPAIRVGSVFGGCLIASQGRLRFAGSVVVSDRRLLEAIDAVSGARAFGIPPAEAWRDER
jgi:hypothetical protein